jgi:hypothetical protein
MCQLSSTSTLRHLFKNHINLQSIYIINIVFYVHVSREPTRYRSLRQSWLTSLYRTKAVEACSFFVLEDCVNMSEPFLISISKAGSGRLRQWFG